MNKRLMDSCIQINKQIIRLNQTHNAHTPKLADTVIQKQGKNRGYKIYEKAFVDGVHASEDTQKVWARLIMDAINRNRKGWAPVVPKLLTTTAAHSDSDPESEQEQPHKRRKFTNERKF